MTRLARPVRLLVVTSSCVVFTVAPAVVSSAVPASVPDTPTVQVVLPVVDGGITVVVAPGGAPSSGPGPAGAAAAPNGSPLPGTNPSPPPGGTPTLGGGEAAPPSGDAPAPPVTAPPAPVTTLADAGSAPTTSSGTGAANGGSSASSSPTTAPAPTTSSAVGSARTWPPLPTARPTYADGSTTPPPATSPATSSPSASPSPAIPGASTARGGASAGPTAPSSGPNGSGAPSGSGAPARNAAGTSSGAGFRFGVFGHSTDRVGRFQEKVGRPVEVLGVFPARGSWETIMDTWWLDTAPPGFQGTLDVGVPLWQDDGDLATAAAGGYDAQWEELGRTIEAKYPGSSVRIGWEFNLGGWHHHATDENVEQWKEAFRRASAALKKGGPSLLVTWNPNKGKGDSLADASKAWPGDEAVDIVALDAYDWWPAYSESTWPEHRDGDQGWQYWVDFARSHGKKFAVPEWGVAPGNDHGGGDNPYYIGVVMDFLAAEHAKDGIVHSVVYFDEPESYIANSVADGQVPLAGEALAGRLSALGGGGGEKKPVAASGGAGASEPPRPDGASPTTPAGAPTAVTDDGDRAEAAGGHREDEKGDDRDPDQHGGGDETKEDTKDTPEGHPTEGATSSGGSGWSSGDGHGPVPR